jgi:hypothetical protein
MNNATSNAEFLATIAPRTKATILTNIANTYGITASEMEEELTTGEPEDIMEYVTIDRSAVYFLYKAFKG